MKRIVATSEIAALRNFLAAYPDVTIRKAKTQLHPSLTEYAIEGPESRKEIMNEAVQKFDTD